MSNNPGLGVMIQMLGGNAESVEIWKSSVGKRIKGLSIIPDAGDGGELRFVFEDQAAMAILDTGQS